MRCILLLLVFFLCRCTKTTPTYPGNMCHLSSSDREGMCNSLIVLFFFFFHLEGTPFLMKFSNCSFRFIQKLCNKDESTSCPYYTEGWMVFCHTLGWCVITVFFQGDLALASHFCNHILFTLCVTPTLWLPSLLTRNMSKQRSMWLPSLLFSLLENAE